MDEPYRGGMNPSGGSGSFMASGGKPLSKADRRGLELALEKLELAETLIGRVLDAERNDPESAEEAERLAGVKAEIEAAVALLRKKLA